MIDTSGVRLAPRENFADLDTWSRRAWTDGVQIDRLQMLDVLAVRTRNSLYEITIVSGEPGAVVVRGGQFFPEPTRAILAGASLGGSFLKQHGIYIGFRMEILHEGQYIITTDVQSIKLSADGRVQ